MIRYSLKCAAGHVFDSWFRDSGAFDALVRAGQVACANCGDTRVEKALMAPSLHADGGEAPAAAPGSGTPTVTNGPLATPATPTERALTKLRQYLSENSDYVGRRFPEEARRMHLGEADARSIWGEATSEEARALAEEGVPVAPLPRLSRRDD